MAFPQDRLPIKAEMLIGGTWADVTSRVRNSDDVRISRGYSAEQASLAAAQCNFTLNNRDGLFSNRNPTSAYYKLLGRNTQFRVSVTESTPFLKLGDYSTSTGVYDGARSSTTDKAVLDVTGDIDIRVDVEPDDWRGGRGQFLASKYLTTGNQRSWAFWVTNLGKLGFIWSPDGTLTNAKFLFSDAATVASGRKTLRVTLDVNNGAGGYTVTFYTGDSVSGSFTQLGSQTVTTAGTTSIFNSTADLMVGSANANTRGAFLINDLIDPLIGRIYRAQVYNGIAGTLVADMNATAQAAGTTSWSDGLTTPNTWTTTASAAITAQNYRFWGEIGDLPQEWDPSGTDVYSRAYASDIIARVQQGQKSFNSPIYRNLSRFLTTGTGTSGTMDGWWPMEQSSSSTLAAAAVGQNATITNATFTTDTDFPGSAGVLQFTDDTGTISGAGVVPSSTSNTGVVTMMLYFRAAAIPVSATPFNFISFYLTGGSVYRCDFAMNNNTYQFRVVDGDGTSLMSSSILFGTGGDPNQPIAMRMMLTQNGSNVDWEAAWYAVNGGLLGSSGSFAATVGRPRAYGSNGFTGKNGWWFSHIAFMREDADFESSLFQDSTDAFVGETPDIRFGRLCREAGLPYFITGRQYDSDDPVGEPMGAQGLKTLAAHFQECADVDGGIITGARDRFGVHFKLRSSIINREAVTLDYAANHLSGALHPKDDLAFVRNDVTVTRDGGAFSRKTKTSGPLNVNEPSADPDGVGTYDPGPITRNTQTDQQLVDFAEDEVFRGTWDELRYPDVTVELARAVFVASSTLTASVRRLNLGDPIKLTNLPSWLPPDPVELLALGYTETLRNRGHEFTFNTVPYGPYRANDLTSSTLSRYRAAASNTILASGITSSATSMVAYTPTGRTWRRSSGAPTGTFPMDVVIEGEKITVGALSNATLSYVAVGTVSHANNASVTPGAPAGKTTGDLLLLFAAIRSTSAFVSTPTGWTRIAEPPSSPYNQVLFARIATGAAADTPTVPFTGGGAGDDTSGQIAAFRPSSSLYTSATLTDLVLAKRFSTNASAQNITYPALPVSQITLDDTLIIYLGWKQDDWTSVSTPGTKISDPSTATGNDQGIAWAYTIQTTAAGISSSVFTVTGGASAVSAGAVVALNLRTQAMTSLTRSVNAVSKAQAAGSDIQVAEPFYVVR